MSEYYAYAKARYAEFGVDTDKAMEALGKFSVSVHCWQGDDVIGFDGSKELSGGIQTTGNYPGRARTPEELMADLDKALSLIGGTHKLNLHASYAIDNENGRDRVEPKHFAPWVAFAKERGMGIDFNPTLFAHSMVKDGLTLSSPDEEVRAYWIRHCKACLRISEYFAEETGFPCVMNIWIPDGFKDIPANRYLPRKRFKESLDEILSAEYDKSKVYVTLESKVFGIGAESYTTGSAEFCLSYSAKNNITPLMDNGHYHPTEMVSDKISSLLLFNEKLALHITRPVRWDSDHVVLLDDETKEICREIVRCDALDRVFAATDYFDASINRVAAWVVGVRNVQKAMLYALLQPNEELARLQDTGNMTELMAYQEELKMLPFGEVWDQFCEGHGVPTGMNWLQDVKEYEEQVLTKRG